MQSQQTLVISHKQIQRNFAENILEEIIQHYIDEIALGDFDIYAIDDMHDFILDSSELVDYASAAESNVDVSGGLIVSVIIRNVQEMIISMYEENKQDIQNEVLETLAYEMDDNRYLYL